MVQYYNVHYMRVRNYMYLYCYCNEGTGETDFNSHSPRSQWSSHSMIL